MCRRLVMTSCAVIAFQFHTKEISWVAERLSADYRLDAQQG
jgi:hypothetical protein